MADARGCAAFNAKVRPSILKGESPGQFPVQGQGIPVVLPFPVSHVYGEAQYIFAPVGMGHLRAQRIRSLYNRRGRNRQFRRRCLIAICFHLQHNDISGGGEIPENVFYAFQDAVGSDGDTWPTEEMWASIGLPALDYAESGENVLLMITNDSLSVTGYADNETLADTLNGLAAMLADAGLAVDSVNTLTGGEQQVADYEYNGIPLQIRIGSNATAQINIFVSVNQ
jgi:hypothetical protein